MESAKMPPTAPAAEEEVKILAPDYSLKNKIGDDINIREILSPENIRRSQEFIRNSQEEFLAWIIKDLVVLEHAYRTAIQDVENSAEQVERIKKMAFTLKAQAGTYGYDLASEVAKSLYFFCENHFKPHENHLLYIRKHIEALTAIVQENIVGHGGLVGHELTHNLRILGHRYIEE